MTFKFKSILAVSILLSLVITLTVLANNTIINNSREFITNDLRDVKEVKAGLLLGTNRKLKNGAKNDFFYNRIDAAAELYNSGKIKYIIVSGDNSTKDYNEPQDMKDELIKQGVPDSVIYLDYAGFRTLDSVVRAKEIFGQSSFIVISQKFHNERAVYIARRNGIEAYGFNAKDVVAFKGIKTKIREYFARDKVFIDLLFNVSPKFAGERVIIN